MCDVCGNPECKGEGWTEADKEIAKALTQYITSATTQRDAVEKLAHLVQLQGTLLGVVPLQLQAMLLELFFMELREVSTKKHGKSIVQQMSNVTDLFNAVAPHFAKPDTDKLH